MPYTHLPGTFIITKDTPLSVIQESPEYVVLQGDGLLPENIAQLSPNTKSVTLDAITEVEVVLALPSSIRSVARLLNCPAHVLNWEIAQRIGAGVEWGTLRSEEEFEEEFSAQVNDVAVNKEGLTNVAFFNLSHSQIERLFHALKANTIIKDFVLNNCKDVITTEIIDELIVAIAHLKLDSIALELNDIDDVQAIKLAAAFNEMDSLSRVSLKQNKITNIGKQAIIAAFVGRSTVIECGYIVEDDKIEADEKLVVPPAEENTSVDANASVIATPPIRHVDTPFPDEVPDASELIGDVKSLDTVPSELLDLNTPSPILEDENEVEKILSSQKPNDAGEIASSATSNSSPTHKIQDAEPEPRTILFTARKMNPGSLSSINESGAVVQIEDQQQVSSTVPQTTFEEVPTDGQVPQLPDADPEVETGCTACVNSVRRRINRLVYG